MHFCNHLLISQKQNFGMHDQFIVHFCYKCSTHSAGISFQKLEYMQTAYLHIQISAYFSELNEILHISNEDGIFRMLLY